MKKHNERRRPEDLKKPLVPGVCRADLLEVGLSDVFVATLTNADLQGLSKSVEETNVAQLFWESLDFSVELRLTRKPNQ